MSSSKEEFVLVRSTVVPLLLEINCLNKKFLFFSEHFFELCILFLLFRRKKKFAFWTVFSFNIYVDICIIFLFPSQQEEQDPNPADIPLSHVDHFCWVHKYLPAWREVVHIKLSTADKVKDKHKGTLYSLNVVIMNTKVMIFCKLNLRFVFKAQNKFILNIWLNSLIKNQDIWHGSPKKPNWVYSKGIWWPKRWWVSVKRKIASGFCCQEIHFVFQLTLQWSWLQDLSLRKDWPMQVRIFIQSRSCKFVTNQGVLPHITTLPPNECFKLRNLSQIPPKSRGVWREKWRLSQTPLSSVVFERGLEAKYFQTPRKNWKLTKQNQIPPLRSAMFAQQLDKNICLRKGIRHQ